MRCTQQLARLASMVDHLGTYGHGGIQVLLVPLPPILHRGELSLGVGGWSGCALDVASAAAVVLCGALRSHGQGAVRQPMKERGLRAGCRWVFQGLSSSCQIRCKMCKLLHLRLRAVIIPGDLHQCGVTTSALDQMPSVV
jgi:hypothetical protein